MCFFDWFVFVYVQGEYKFNDLMVKGNIIDLDLLVGVSFCQYMFDFDGLILFDIMG